MTALLVALLLPFSATADRHTVTAVAAADGTCRFGYEQRLDGWDKETYVLLPAAAYDGNRAFTPIPPVAPDYGAWYETSDVGSDVFPFRMHAKIPALAADNSGVLEGAAGDLSTPCAAFYFPKTKRGLICWFEPQLKGRDAGYTLSNGVLRIDYPARRKEFLFARSDAIDPPLACAPGERLSVNSRTDEFPCTSVAELFAAFFRLRRSFVSAPREPLPAAAERRRLASLVAKRMVDDSIRDVPDRGMTWSCGWCGGPMNVVALANVGWPGVNTLAAATLDHLARLQQPCGLFAGLTKDGVPQPERPSHPETASWHLTRRSADALFYAVPLLDLAGATPTREAALTRCADALVTIFEKYGELPQYVDQKTGTRLIAGSTSAAMAPAALVRMANRFNAPRYREAAAKIADQMCRTYLARGLSFGGPGDAADACDSESAYALLESCVALAEPSDGTERTMWLARAETAAHLVSTWIVPYRYQFPATSEYGKRGVNTVGSVIANHQNRHAAPGFCTASGDALVRLAKLTGNAAYRELYDDVISFFPQVIATPERPIRATLWTTNPRNLDVGAINERVNMSGWEGAKGVGEVFPGPCWSELSFLLIPGLTEETVR